MKTQSLLTTNAASRGPGMESSQDCMRTNYAEQAFNFQTQDF